MDIPPVSIIDITYVLFKEWRMITKVSLNVSNGFLSDGIVEHNFSKLLFLHCLQKWLVNVIVLITCHYVSLCTISADLEL